MSINRVILTGNLTKDPELRTTASGMSVLTIRLAVNDRRKNNGVWEDVPNYFDVVVFGSRAEGLSYHLYRGMKVAVDGKLRWSEWESQDGGKRSKVEIVADDVELLTPKAHASGGPSSDPIGELGGEEIPF